MIKERIILAPGANQSELLKSLSKCGKFSFGTRIVSSLELANIALERKGISIGKSFISNIKEASLIYHELKKIDYYKQFVYVDACQLMSSINSLRQYVLSDNDIQKLKEDNFKNKNESIKKLFSLYLEKLDKENLIDEIQIIRLAIENNCYVDDVEFVCLSEFDLTPLEEKLLNVVSNGNYLKESLADLNKPLKIKSYTKAFGSTNEIEGILSYIKDKKLPLDQCEIITTEPVLYSKILANYKDLLDFNFSIGVSQSLMESNPGKLFSALDVWDINNYFVDYLHATIDAYYFDKDKLISLLDFSIDNIEINSKLSRYDKITFDSIIDRVGQLKLSFDKDSNDEKIRDITSIYLKHKDNNPNDIFTIKEGIELEFIIRFKDILNKGRKDFLINFTKIDSVNSSRDINVLNSVSQLLEISERFDIPYEDIRSSISSISIGSSSSSSGSIYFTSISRAMSVIRPYVFIVGLSNNYFPGGPKEDSNILDEDYEVFKEVSHSNKLVTKKKAEFISLISLLNTYSKEIHLSYSVYNTESLKEQSCSSLLLDIYKRENGNTKTLKDFMESFNKGDKDKYISRSFFSSDLLTDNNIGKELLNNNEIEKEEAPIKNNELLPVDNYQKIALSASRVLTYISCPYRFYLQNVIGLPDPIENDLFDVMSSIDAGNLVHNILETFDKSKESKEELKNRTIEALNEYFITHPTNNKVAKKLKIDEILQMIDSAYEKDDNLPSLLAEENLSCLHKESGLYIHGFPDKVVINPDGTLKIIDYKTKNRVEHDFTNVETVIQLVMYSYIIEHSKVLKMKDGTNYKVSCLEFRYFKADSVIGYDIDTYYQKLDSILISLATSFKTGNFGLAPVNECKYCKYKSMCGR